MEKRIKKWSLFTWMITLFTMCALVSLFLSMTASNVIKMAQNTLIETREISPGSEELKDGSHNIRINKDSNKTYVIDVIRDDGLYHFLEWMLIAMPILIFSISLFLSAWLFYRYKLKAPIHALQDSIGHIEQQNLDFCIPYKSEDELGLLCRAFDTMREKLKDAFVSLWAEKEKQIILTRALAHDLRTPLTVIKGHNDLIAMSLRNKSQCFEQLEAATIVMGENIIRMENYLDNAREMQALEDWQLCPRPVSGTMVAEKIRDMQTLCDQVSLVVDNKMQEELSLDEALVMRVLENLIVNAFEHAMSMVTVSIECKDSFLTVLVEDDGKGFSPDALHHAAIPFFREDMAHSLPHMGLGLTIAQILVERHSGKIFLGNHNNGAYVKVAFKSL